MRQMCSDGCKYICYICERYLWKWQLMIGQKLALTFSLCPLWASARIVESSFALAYLACLQEKNWVEKWTHNSILISQCSKTCPWSLPLSLYTYRIIICTSLVRLFEGQQLWVKIWILDYAGFFFLLHIKAPQMVQSCSCLPSLTKR